MYNPDDYESIGVGLARTGTLSRETEAGQATAGREPVYPVLLAIFFKTLGHSPATIFLVNGLLFAGTVLGLFLVGKRLFDEEVGLLASGIAAFYPPFIYYASSPRRETALAFLGVMTVLTLVKAIQGSNRHYAAAGVLSAATALTCTTYLPFGLGTTPVLLLWLGRARPLRAVKCVFIYCLFFVALYSLWPLRNYKQFHTFVLGTTSAGGTVFYVNQLVPSEVGGLPEEHDILDRDPVMNEGGRIPDPAAREKFFWKAGVDKIKQDPGRYVKLVAKRFFVDAMRVTPRPRSYEHSFKLLWWIGLLTDGWIIPLGLLGLLFWRYKPPEAIFVPAFIASVNLVYAMLFFILRYRIPVMPWFILLAALSIIKLIRPGADRVNPG